MRTFLPRLARAPARRTIAAMLAVEVAIIVAVYAVERATLRATRDRITYREGGLPERWRPYRIAGIVRPPAVPAGEAAIPDDAEVIGVEVGGRARAYRIDALRDRFHHIVNDLVGGVPVSVAYCDLTDCVRVYTDPRGEAPLDVAVGGLYDGAMVVRLDGRLYDHRSGRPLTPESGRGGDARPGAGEFPYDLLTPERTSWREWKARHPVSDAYVGGHEYRGK